MGIQPTMLDPDPDLESMNPDPKHWERETIFSMVFNIIETSDLWAGFLNVKLLLLKSGLQSFK
jgi:hypothetical protein